MDSPGIFSMSKRSQFTHITPLPPSVSRNTAVQWLHNHREMIELNPLVLRHHRCSPVPNAPAEEVECVWYEMTDQINYLPGGFMKGEVTYKAAFHDLPTGLQTHVYAPAGLDLREKWTVCGNQPDEPRIPVEMGSDVPRDGLYIREDVDMRCSVFLLAFIKKNLSKAHKTVVDRVVEKAGVATSTNPSIESQDGYERVSSPPENLARPSGREKNWSTSDSIPSAQTKAANFSSPSSNRQSRREKEDVRHERPQWSSSSSSNPQYVSHTRARGVEPHVDEQKPLPSLPLERVPYEPFSYVKVPSMDSEPQLFSGNFHPLSHYQLLLGNEVRSEGDQEPSTQSPPQSVIQAELPAEVVKLPVPSRPVSAIDSAPYIPFEEGLHPAPLVTQRPYSTTSQQDTDS